MADEFDVLVVGGGFFGCMIALHLRRSCGRVAVVEKHAELLTRASFANQARVHQGYHYPRSLLTGLRSRANFARFVRDFAPCIDDSFAKYYAVGRTFSKVSAAQFELFCRRIGAPIGPAPAVVRRLFDPATVEEVFRVTEVAFDAARLREMMRERLAAAGVTVILGTEVRRVEALPGGGLAASLAGPGGDSLARAGQVFNCTYSQLNQLRTASGLAPVPLKHELAELALVRVPAELRGLGVTVMCGPFFSVMPFPPAGLHTLSHVRYTPHGSWAEPAERALSPHQVFERWPRRTHFESMRRDAARFLPLLARAEHERSLWEVKTVLPANEADDGRPILFLAHAGLPNFHCVLGAKIDNVFDALEQIDLLSAPRARVA